MTEHEIVAKAEKHVKEWIDYAKQEYGWEDKVFELFEEPMIEVATAVAVQTTKDLQKENRKLLESCEGATMMYKDLCKAIELINTLLLIADNKVSQMEFQLCIADTKQFLKKIRGTK
jgi:hypothetical protein